MLLRLANILTTAVVAHILDPSDFGVFAVALTAYAIVSSIGDLGVASCLKRADLDIDSLAPTVATVSLITSGILAAAMAAFAGPIAAALGSAEAAGPVRVMSLAVMLVGIFAVPDAQLMRDFKQKKIFLANAISFIPSTAALLLLAKLGSGAMAFAWSRVIGQFIVGCVIIASVSHNYRPGYTRRAASLLFRFGLPLAGANFANYILLNVDYALIGRLLGSVALGTYVLAFNVASWPASFLSGLINTVSMPAFSRVKHDTDLLKRAIASALRAISMIVMPMCGLTIALAQPLVLTLYGAQWAGSARVLSILPLYGAVSIICTLFANMLAGLGRTKLLLVVQLIWLGVLAPAMWLGVHSQGIVGAAWAHIIVIVPIVLPCYLIVLKRATGVSIAALMKAVFPAVLASAASALAARATAYEFSKPVTELVMGLIAGGSIYIVAAVPQAIALFSRGQSVNRRLRGVLRTYDTAALLVGLPVNTRQARHSAQGGVQRLQREPKQAAGPGKAQLAQVIDQPADEAVRSTEAALALLISLARPAATAPPDGRVLAQSTGPLERYVV
jgi:lipopolysaccharide exporter